MSTSGIGNGVGKQNYRDVSGFTENDLADLQLDVTIGSLLTAESGIDFCYDTDDEVRTHTHTEKYFS